MANAVKVDGATRVHRMPLAWPSATSLTTADGIAGLRQRRGCIGLRCWWRPAIPDLGSIIRGVWSRPSGQYSRWPDFPNLVRNDTLKTGDATTEYNGIRFALGPPLIGWINPPNTLSAFIQLFESEGWVVCDYDEGQVDGWALADGTMKHAGRFTSAWESKCGANIRISHVRNQLGSHPIPGSLYGDIVVSFRKPAHHTAETTISAAETTINAAPTTIEIFGDAEAEHVARIDSIVKPLEASFSLVDEFEVRFKAWKDTWFTPPMLNKQSSKDRAQGREWNALVAMTAKILPHVVKKLHDPSNMFVVELYNTLQTDPKKRVPPTDIREYYYLEVQAKKIISLYVPTIAAFDEQVAAWNAHQIRVQFSSHSRDYIRHPSYDAIVAMGKDHVVPLIMARYAEDQCGWWHELLYETVHGRKSGANEFYWPKLYQQWKEWYENPGAA